MSKGKLRATEVYALDSYEESCDTQAKNSAARWRAAGYSARVFQRWLKVDTEAIPCWIVVVRHKGGA